MMMNCNTAFALGMLALLPSLSFSVAVNNELNMPRIIDGSNTFEQMGMDLLGTNSTASVNAAAGDPTASAEHVMFGQTVSIATNPTTGDIRLAVGAPLHDYRLPHAALPLENAGALLVYQYNNEADLWYRLVFRTGRIGEMLGRAVVLSKHGNRVAFRRYLSDAASTVTVLDVDNPRTRLGPDVSTGAEGEALALSDDGKRLAVSGDTFDNDRGLVELFEYDEMQGRYLSMGPALEGPAIGVKFGHAIAFAQNGNRLFVSAPSYSGETGNRPFSGLICVYDYDGTAWVKQDDLDLLGLTVAERFGASLAVSADGNSIIVGSPGATNRDDGPDGLIKGKAQAFRRSGGADGGWTPIGEAMYGERAGDRLGVSVSMNDDATVIMTGSSTYRGDRSLVRLYKLYGDNRWMQYGETMTNASPDDQLASRRTSLSLSPDGNEFVCGAPGYQHVGRVQMFSTQGVRAMETLAPTQAPTAELLPHVREKGTMGICYFNVDDKDEDESGMNRRLAPGRRVRATVASVDDGDMIWQVALDLEEPERVLRGGASSGAADIWGTTMVMTAVVAAAWIVGAF